AAGEFRLEHRDARVERQLIGRAWIRGQAAGQDAAQVLDEQRRVAKLLVHIAEEERPVTNDRARKRPAELTPRLGWFVVRRRQRTLRAHRLIAEILEAVAAIRVRP